MGEGVGRDEVGWDEVGQSEKSEERGRIHRTFSPPGSLLASSIRSGKSRFLIVA